MLQPEIPKSVGLLRIKQKRQLKYKGHCMYVADGSASSYKESTGVTTS